MKLILILTIGIILIFIILFIMFLCYLFRLNRNEFDRSGIHKNGTPYDTEGYDVHGYNRDGYNKEGYNREGKKASGKYNRSFDIFCYKDGLSNVKEHPVIVTTHARERMLERMEVKDISEMEKIAFEAFCFGKSKRQMKKSSAYLLEESTARSESNVPLIYRGYIYIFTSDNKLVTVYKNEKIPL